MELDIRAKRIVNIDVGNGAFILVAFDYYGNSKKDARAACESQEAVEINVHDTNGSFTPQFKTVVTEVEARNEGNWGAPDDVLVIHHMRDLG